MAFAEANDVQAVMQTSVVKGRILDSTGEPIIGASIIEKGTTNGTITDIDGNFSLSVSSSKAILVVSYLGYKSVELSASDKKLNEIVLKEDTEMLDEQYSELNQMSDEAAYSYENVIRYKNKGKTASGIYTDSQSSAVCI